MRPSLGQSCLAVLRATTGLTQQQLAELVQCSRPTIQAIELNKLGLSQKLAARVSFHTGISAAWLLKNEYNVPPVCRDNPNHPYTREVFEKTRRALTKPRTSAAHLVVLEQVLAWAYRHLGGVLLAAYRSDKTAHFNHELRQWVAEMESHFVPSKDLPPAPVGVTAGLLHDLLEKERLIKSERLKNQILKPTT